MAPPCALRAALSSPSSVHVHVSVHVPVRAGTALHF